MPLLVHDSKYAESAHLHAPLEWPDFRIEHRRLKPGSLTPVTFTCNSVVVALAGCTPVRRAAAGEVQRAVIYPGMACVEPAGLDETQAEIASPLECLHIHLSPALIGQSALAEFDTDPTNALLAYAGGLHDLLLNQIAMALHGVISRGLEPADRLLIEGARSVLVWRLLARYAVGRWRPSQFLPSLSYAKLKSVVDMVEARLGEPIALRDLAAEAGLSEFHFSRLFREATGRSPHRYVTERRIHTAQEELAKGSASLAEIALDVGFGSQASFHRAFRKHTGQTPGQFRRRKH